MDDKDQKVTELQAEVLRLRRQLLEVQAELNISKSREVSGPGSSGDVHERLFAVLQNIAEGIIITDRLGRIVLVNKAAAELTGWDANEAVGRMVEDVYQILAADTRRPCGSYVTETLQSGRAVKPARQVILTSRNKEERVVADNVAPIEVPGTGQEPLGAVLVFKDVTSQTQMEADVQRAAKLESIGVLAGGIAHDFNNLLAAITGNAGLAQMALYGNDVPRAQLSLIEVENAAIRARDLTQQLLTFARGGAPLKTIVNLEPLLQDAASFALSGSRNSCRIDAHGLWPMNADGAQITQVINNLLINADQASPEASEILIRAENVRIAEGSGLPLSAGPYVKISVTDKGVGIPPEIISRVFDPFFSTKQRGSGLGLTSVYAIVKAHDGHISVESKVGGGTTFTIYLPASPGQTLQTDKAAPPPAVLQMLRILVMDDEEMLRDMLYETLSTLGHVVITVPDGKEAIKAYQKAIESAEPFDLVILDLTVPAGMGGKEAISRLREIDPDVKAICSSGYATDPIMANAGAFGFVGRLAKPYRIAELEVLIAELCGPRGIRRPPPAAVRAKVHPLTGADPERTHADL